MNVLLSTVSEEFVLGYDDFLVDETVDVDRACRGTARNLNKELKSVEILSV